MMQVVHYTGRCHLHAANIVYGPGPAGPLDKDLWQFPELPVDAEIKDLLVEVALEGNYIVSYPKQNLLLVIPEEKVELVSK